MQLSERLCILAIQISFLHVLDRNIMFEAFVIVFVLFLLQPIHSEPRETAVVANFMTKWIVPPSHYAVDVVIQTMPLSREANGSIVSTYAYAPSRLDVGGRVEWMVVLRGW
jgi:hypothetical protein